MPAGQAGQSRPRFESEASAGPMAELVRDEHPAIVAKADEATIEGGVPESGQKQAVVDVKALSIVNAFGPRDDVRSAKQGGFHDSCKWTATGPIFHERRPEDVLAHSLDRQALGFGSPGQVENFGLELREWDAGQADAETPGTVDGVMQVGCRGQLERECGGSIHVRSRHAKFRGYGLVGQRQPPGTKQRSPRQPDLQFGSSRPKAEPFATAPALKSKTVVRGGLLQFRAQQQHRAGVRPCHRSTFNNRSPAGVPWSVSLSHGSTRNSSGGAVVVVRTY